MSKDITPLPASSGADCRKCGKSTGLLDIDAGTDREVERLCVKCFALSKQLPASSGEKEEQDEKEMPTAAEWLREYEIMCSVMPTEKAMATLVNMVFAEYEKNYC